MKDGARNVPRALILGVSAVVVLYVLMNVMYVYALPMETIISSSAVVQSAAAAMFSPRLGDALAIMVALSCFGAMSSAILCTARIFYAMAQDGVFFARMADVHPQWRTPAFALVVQGAWASVLALIGLYDQLLTYAIFMMIVSYVVTVGALFVLRKTKPDHPRPYRCTGYPVVPLLYLLLAGAWLVNTVWARPLESLAGLGLVALGVPGYLYWRRRSRV
jgi:APA family basic amino acid/polyamine antiporter